MSWNTQGREFDNALANHHPGLELGFVGNEISFVEMGVNKRVSEIGALGKTIYRVQGMSFRRLCEYLESAEGLPSGAYESTESTEMWTRIGSPQKNPELFLSGHQMRNRLAVVVI